MSACPSQSPSPSPNSPVSTYKLANPSPVTNWTCGGRSNHRFDRRQSKNILIFFVPFPTQRMALFLLAAKSRTEQDVFRPQLFNETHIFPAFSFEYGIAAQTEPYVYPILPRLHWPLQHPDTFLLRCKPASLAAESGAVSSITSIVRERNRISAIGCKVSAGRIVRVRPPLRRNVGHSLKSWITSSPGVGCVTLMSPSTWAIASSYRQDAASIRE